MWTARTFCSARRGRSCRNETTWKPHIEAMGLRVRGVGCRASTKTHRLAGSFTPMIETFVGRVTLAGTFRSLFQIAASLSALATVGTWFDYGNHSWTDTDAVDDRLAAIGTSPLTVAYHVLIFLGIPHEWVITGCEYLAAHSHRATAFSIVTMLLDFAVTCTVSPDGDVPSLQASTWWVWEAATVQSGGFYLLFTGLAIWLIDRTIRHRGVRGTPQRWADEATLDVERLLAATIFAPLMSPHPIFDRWSNYRPDPLGDSTGASSRRVRQQVAEMPPRLPYRPYRRTWSSGRCSSRPRCATGRSSPRRRDP